MKSGYYKRVGSAALCVLDLTDYYNRGLMITRINTPMAYRGKGYASEVLKECITDADREGVKLFLEIVTSDGLDHAQLEAWYKRHGFLEVAMGVYRRRPWPSIR